MSASQKVRQSTLCSSFRFVFASLKVQRDRTYEGIARLFLIKAANYYWFDPYLLQRRFLEGSPDEKLCQIIRRPPPSECE